MKRIIIWSFIIGVAISSYFAIRTMKAEHQAKYETSVTMEQVMQVPLTSAVIGYHTLFFCDANANYKCEFESFQESMALQLRKTPFMDPHPIINIYIASGGGQVEIMDNIIINMNNLQKMGVKFHCYVERAYSGAFTILQACDKRIGLKGSKYLTHAIHNGSYTSKDMYLGTIKHCTYEALKMKKDIKQWCKQSRIIGKDMIFSAEEALMINLIDSIL